jgi:hypothetical protein
MFIEQVKIFFLKIDIERSEPQALIGMNSLFLSHRVEHAVFEVKLPSEIEVLFDIGYGCSAIDDYPQCSYATGKNNKHRSKKRPQASDFSTSPSHGQPELGKYSLHDECFFYNIEEATNFFQTHKYPKKRDYHNVHCFLKSDAQATDAIVRQEAEQYKDQLLEYDGNFFRIVSKNGKPFLKEEQQQVHGGVSAPSSSSAVSVSFRTMFLIESDLT